MIAAVTNVAVSNSGGSGIALLVFLGIAVAVNGVYFVRRARINAQRRGHGYEGLNDEQVGALKRLGRDPGTATPADVTQADALVRQMAWEKFEMQSEMVKNGRAFSRSHCRVHDRYCKYANEPGHPPGGNRNTAPPADWIP